MVSYSFSPLVSFKLHPKLYLCGVFLTSVIILNKEVKRILAPGTRAHLKLWLKKSATSKMKPAFFQMQNEFGFRSFAVLHRLCMRIYRCVVMREVALSRGFREVSEKNSWRSCEILGIICINNRKALGYHKGQVNYNNAGTYLAPWTLTIGVLASEFLRFFPCESNSFSSTTTESEMGIYITAYYVTNTIYIL